MLLYDSAHRILLCVCGVLVYLAGYLQEDWVCPGPQEVKLSAGSLLNA